MSNKPDDYLFQEVFVAGVDHITASAGELVVLKSFEDLIDYLSTKSVNVNPDVRVLHGILTSGKAIPQDFCGRQVFILIVDPSSEDGWGLLIDSDSEDDCHGLASEIEKLLANEEIAANFVDIDNVYVLYGYEIPVSLSVNEDDLDEDMIASCAKVALHAKELAKEIEYEED